MGTTKYTEFKKALEGSREGVARVADWLAGMGKSVIMCGQAIAPDLSSVSEFVDHGDLYVLKRIEVKHLSAKFTGAHDWPFGRHFIVNSKSTFDKIKKKNWPEAFIALNDEMTHAACLNVKDSRKDWYVQERNDKIFGPKPYYICPIKKVTFHPLT